MGKIGVTQSGIHESDMEQLPIIPLGNVPIYTNKNPTVSSVSSLKTKTSKIYQLKTQPKLQSQDQESTPYSLGFESSLVTTKVDYTTAICPKQPNNS